jgi:hypothetical protein
VLGFDRRGDATRGDFDGSGYGTIAATSSGADLLSRLAAVTVAVPANPFTGAVPIPGSLAIGVGAIVLLIAYAYRRVL